MSVTHLPRATIILFANEGRMGRLHHCCHILRDALGIGSFLDVFKALLKYEYKRKYGEGRF